METVEARTNAIRTTDSAEGQDKPKLISYENLGASRKKPGVGVWGGEHLYYFQEDINPKVCIITLLHLGLVTFRIPLKTKSHNFHNIRTWWACPCPPPQKNQLCSTLETPEHSK